MNQEFYGPFAAMELPADFRQPLFGTVLQIDGPASARPKAFEALREKGESIIRGVRVEGNDGFQLEAEFRPSDLLPPSNAANMFPEQVSCDTQQPWTDQGTRIKPRLRHVETQKDFLRHVFGVARLQKSRSEVPVNGPLMPFNN